MAFPSIKYKTGKVNKWDDPNQINTFKTVGGNPFKKGRRRKRKKAVESELEEIIKGYLGGIFILLPMLLFFIYLFPKFFVGLAVVLLFLYHLKKLPK